MPSSKNERNAENVVRDELRRLGYYDDNGITIEEQKSNIEAVKRLLKSASKSGQGGKGAPEFIISAPSTPDFIIIIECKGNSKDHISASCRQLLGGKPIKETEEQYANRTKRYAGDGALHYAKWLAKEFNVIAVAVSGETKKEAIISAYLFPKNSDRPKPLQTKHGMDIDKLLSWSDFIEHGTFDPTVQRLRFNELMEFSHDLHDFMRDHAKLTESEKPLVVSGTLIALRSKAFALSYDAYTPEDLQKEWMRVIRDEIQKAEIPKAKKDNMTQPYSSIAVHPELGKATKSYPKGVLHELIKRLNEKVFY